MNKIAIIILLFFPLFSFAQIKILGLVLNDKKQVLEGATISLTVKDSSKVAFFTVVDSVGNFSFKAPANKYILNISYLNQNLFNKEISVYENVDLGILQVQEPKNNMLQAVNVSSRKKLIERKLDRFVLNVENSPLFTGGTAFDAIKKAPGIYLGSNEGINIMGKSGVKVMVDNRLIYMNPDELNNFLKGFNADNIKSIEVITTPSSKYDAEGNAGIINIVTKTGGLIGWNAIIGITGYKGVNGRLIGNIGLNYKNNVIDFISTYTAGNVQTFEKIEQRNNLLNPKNGEVKKYTSLNYENRKEYQQTLNGQLDVKLNVKSNIGVSGNLFSDFSPRPSENKTNASDNTSFNSENNHKLKLFNYSLDLYFNHKLDSMGKTMKITANVSNYQVNDHQQLRNAFFVNNVFKNESLLRSFFDNNTKIYASNIDFSLPLKKFSIETGAKIAHINTNNDFNFQNFRSNEWQGNSLLSNKFDYNETNTSGYFSLNKDFSNQLSMQLGLRGEYTHTSGFSLTTNKKTDYDYMQLFPTFYFQYKPINKDYIFNLSYSRRISRPPFSYLNPFISYQSPLFSNEGNPLLRPSFTNSLEITGVLKNKYIFTLFGNITSKFFSEFPLRVADTDETRYTFGNIGTNNNYGIQVVAPFKLTKWWELSNTLLLMQQNYNLRYQMIQQNLNKLFWLINTRHTFTVNKTITAELSASYNAPSVQGFYQVGNYADLSAAVNIKLLKDKATFSLGMNDILYTNRVIVNIHYPKQQLGFTRYNDTRLLKISFKYKFGNINIKNTKKSQSGSIEEQNRAK